VHAFLHVRHIPAKNPVRLAFSRLFSVSQQCFSLTTNQPTVLSATYFQPSEQAVGLLSLRSAILLHLRYVLCQN